MIVLIVDDEEHVREGIDLAVDWERLGVTERLQAEDGFEALELIRERRPAVMLCDMSMPGMDGIQLLEQVRRENQEIQIVVLSGHDDFHYTRAAIRAGGLDYLLKPFAKRELEQCLERALDDWKRKVHRLHEQREAGFMARKADAYLDEQKMAAYFRGEAPGAGIRELLRKVGLPEKSIRAALILPRNRAELVRRRFHGDADLFLFAVNNIMHDTMQSHGAHYLCRLDDYQWLLLTAMREGAGAEAQHRQLLERTERAWSRTIGLNVLVGIAAKEADAEQLLSALGEARSALLRCNVLEQSQRVHDEAELPHLTDKLFLLEQALETGSKTLAAEAVHAVAEQLRRRGTLRLKDLQALTVEANHMLHQASRGPTDEDLADVLLPLWISDVSEWEKLLIQSWEVLIDLRSGEGLGSGGVQAIREHIDRHFAEDVSLSSLSKQFNFSPQYIARKFKETYQTTVTAYITSLRIEHAKALLRQTEMTVAEIAERVGYADENYFGKVFKKQLNVSPLQYRKRLTGS